MSCNNLYSTKPTVDESPEICDGEFHPSNCVVMSERDIFLRLRAGDTLTEVIARLSEEIERLTIEVNNLKHR